MKQRLLILLALIAGIAICVMLAMGFLCIAFYFYLAPMIGPIWAALSVAAIFIALAVSISCALYVFIKNAKEKLKAAVRFGALAALGPAAVRTATRGVGGGLGTLAAMAAGFLKTRRARSTGK
ncbi:MAG: hypothetical protein V4691_08005 [Pseudomonadota bacterium]